VSSDHDQAAFDQYFAEMSFGAMPYEERKAKAEVAAKLGIRGIPSLHIFGPIPLGGEDRPLINNNVRSIIEQGDYISDFPFTPKPYGDLNTTSDDINAASVLLSFTKVEMMMSKKIFKKLCKWRPRRTRAPRR